MVKKSIQLIVLIFLAGILLLFAANFLLVENTNNLQKADAILVLGYKVNDDGNLSPTLQSRVDKGMELYKKGFSKHLIFTGGAVANSHIESLAMKKYAIENGIDKNALFAETQSQNTIENAFYSDVIFQSLQAKKIIVVSSAYHTKRAKKIFSNYTYQTQYVAVKYPNEVGFIGRIKAIMHEYLSWLYYTVNGWQINTNLSAE